VRRPPTNAWCGGLVVAQAILTASLETQCLPALPAFCIGGGEKQRAFYLKVERSRDGGSTQFVPGPTESSMTVSKENKQ
jgi:acyl-CoA thioesterase